jgi:hypothetical protein
MNSLRESSCVSHMVGVLLGSLDYGQSLRTKMFDLVFFMEGRHQHGTLWWKSLLSLKIFICSRGNLSHDFSTCKLKVEMQLILTIHLTYLF